MKRIFAGLFVVSLLAGCASSGKHAPVVERGTAAKAVKPTEKDWRPKVHVVQRGDTLYAIAFNYGLDPRELAEQNAIQDPNVIYVGQQINLFGGPVSPRPVVESRSPQSLVKDQPKVAKYPYSEAAVAQAEAVQSTERGTPVLAKVDARPKAESKVEAKPDNKAESVAGGGADDALEWSMPTQGKLIGTFSEADNRKGIDFAGKPGQAIFASAPGKVVYSGSGLRGYGKLLIIKHNKTYLSAYAHNDQLLVKEGETVTRGQKIAEMGSTDSDQVKLHFEVRRLGKPVDPANYLSLNKS
ncbi:MAG: peptidoglycan DD-metalloendopeptidase family protein [Gallionella sp.]|jgi:lipoprotein NlpD